MDARTGALPRELIILPCDEEDNILATVDEIAIPFPEKKEAFEESETTEIPELKHPRQGEQLDINAENEPRLFPYKGVIFCLIFSMTVIVVILIISKRNKNAKK